MQSFPFHRPHGPIDVRLVCLHISQAQADTFLCIFQAWWDRRDLLCKWFTGEEDEEQKGQGYTDEGALAVHVFHHGMERQIQKAEP